MLNIQKIRDDKDYVKKNLETKGVEVGVIDQIYDLDQVYRKHVQEVEELKKAVEDQRRKVEQKFRENEDLENQVSELTAQVKGKQEEIVKLFDEVERLKKEVSSVPTTADNYDDFDRFT